MGDGGRLTIQDGFLNVNLNTFQNFCINCPCTANDRKVRHWNIVTQVFMVLENITLGIFERFASSRRYSHVFRSSCSKVTSGFANVRGIANSTRIFINNVASEFFGNSILEWKNIWNGVIVTKKPNKDWPEGKNLQ